MRRGMIIAALMMLALVSSVCAEDLYRVEINNQADATALVKTGFDAVVRLNNAYLVITKGDAEEIFRSKNLDGHLIESSVDRNNMAVDASFEPDRNKLYRTVFEEDGIRLVHVPGGITPDQIGFAGLTPLPSKGLRVIFKEPVRLSEQKVDRSITLDSVISLIEYDSLWSYDHMLQAFPNRLTGSSGNRQSRDWIYNSLINFGLDSVYIDTFSASLGQAYNVVGIKYGTIYPDHQIIMGAHRDAVSSSPGADDNGSGTSAVMEMARIFSGIETKMSFKFILFDAEEQGLYGSWHYADAAAAAGDSIVMMLNLDMCAAIGNDGDAKLYHGTDTSYVYIWRNMAAGLDGIDISGHFSGNISASDHYPFTQNGYDVAFPFEYVFSTVYHTYQDSTTYMNFDYMTRMVKASAATAYYVDGYYIPTPSLRFVFRDGAPPEYIAPGVETSMGVNVVGTSGGVPIPGTGQLHYIINGGAVQTVDMPQSSDNRYTAILPAQDCGDEIEFYMSAEEESEGRIYDPDPALAYRPTVATQVMTVFQDDFETVQGWTVSGGSWQRGTPTGSGGDHGSPDPTSGHSGSNVYGYNLSGGYENAMPERHLTSPAIDCSSLINAHLKFWRWLGVEQSAYDHAYVRVSNNGTNWTTVWENDETIDDGGWVEMDLDISGIADGQPAVYLRYTMGTTDGSWTYCGWNIDDVEITGYQCVADMQITTTDLPDWTAGMAYSQQLEVIGSIGTLTWTDKYNDLNGTGLTLSSDGLLSGMVAAGMTVSFTAEVSDEVPHTAEQPLSFVINPAVTITTATLPDWTQGIAFNETLAATGGTGSVIWSDKMDDLSGSGLSLGPNGVLSGIPTSAGTIGFTALAEDQIGASGEKILQVDVNPAVEITMTTVPEGTEGEAYACQLTCTGGTGGFVWSDMNGDLDGIGLELSSSGLISGTPLDTMSMSFMAGCADALGSHDEQTFDLNIVAAFVCGDVTDEGNVDLLDILYLIDYKYGVPPGTAPEPMESGDVDGDEAVNLIDILYLIDYIYGEPVGPAPNCP